MSNVDLVENSTCLNGIKTIGIIKRKTRRKIINENELIQLINYNISSIYCKDINNFNCKVNVKILNFGEDGKHLEDDLLSVQDLSVMIGIQGSGLINGLFAPITTAVIALYYNNGWPLSNGDPLQILNGKGAYIRHINDDPSRIYCNSAIDKVIIYIFKFLLLQFLYISKLI